MSAIVITSESVHDVANGRMRARTKRELVLFFGLTLTLMYGLCFTVVGFLAPMQEFSKRHLGGIDPQLMLYLAAYSPTLMAFVLTARFGGKAGLRRFVAGIFRWRVGVRPWLLALLFFPVLWLLVAVSRHLTIGAPIHWASWYANFPLLVFSTYLFTDTGGLGEEAGWRGYAMPRLLEGFTPATAGLIVGFFFGIWHLPGWFLTGLGGHFAQLDFAMFVGSTMAVSVGMAYLYIRTRGSAFLAGILPHMMNNIAGEEGVKFYEPNWEYIGYLALLMLVLVAIESRRMSRRGALAPQDLPQYYTAEEVAAATPMPERARA